MEILLSGILGPPFDSVNQVKGVAVGWRWVPSGRHFAIADLEGFVLAHRFELIAELLGMVQRWIKAGRPIPTDAARHTVSQNWAATIDGILRANGHDGFLSNFDRSEQDFDLDHAAIRDVCAAFHEQPAGSATAWAKTLKGSGQL